MYKKLCEFVHFSNRHIFTSIAKMDDATRTVHFEISAKDPKRPDDDYFEIVHAFFDVMDLTGSLLGGWQMAKGWKNSPPTPDAA
jgi:hypothetical protein